ncbi:Conserved_hypothetical protein [Hexamita inflata]|uniref:Uncharacterized protein n=1 Tax=Hexamita inflata TaxID=28002 RepID=A0AA86QMH3_9EUKA|nr:Conserved hypothetical protein [Hexamita inflata]
MSKSITPQQQAFKSALQQQIGKWAGPVKPTARYVEKRVEPESDLIRSINSKLEGGKTVTSDNLEYHLASKYLQLQQQFSTQEEQAKFREVEEKKRAEAEQNKKQQILDTVKRNITHTLDTITKLIHVDLEQNASQISAKLQEIHQITQSMAGLQNTQTSAQQSLFQKSTEVLMNQLYLQTQLQDVNQKYNEAQSHASTLEQENEFLRQKVKQMQSYQGFKDSFINQLNFTQGGDAVSRIQNDHLVEENKALREQNEMMRLNQKRLSDRTKDLSEELLMVKREMKRMNE